MKSSIKKSWKSITRDNYNEHAEEFATFTTIYRGKLQKWIDYFLSQNPAGASILDCGCGAGRDASYFANKGFVVTGIDFSQQLINIAKKKVPEQTFLVMDFEKLSFPNNSFDGIWASASLLHVPRNRLLTIFEKLHLILKDKGLFFSCFRIGEGERITREQRGNAILERFYCYYQPQEIEELLKRAGFVNITSEMDTIVSGDWIGFFARK